MHRGLINAKGFERALLMEFPETSFAIAGVDEAGDRRSQFGTVAVGADADELLFGRGIEFR